MTALDRKLLRDLWRMRGQALAIALVLAAAAATFVMSLGVHRSLDETRDAYYARNHFADVFAEMTRAPRSLVDRVAAIPGVQRAEGIIQQYATLYLPGTDDLIRGLINSVNENGGNDLNRVTLRQGRMPRPGRPEEVVVDEAFAGAHDLVPGDEIDALIYGTKQRLKIVGIGLAPNFIFAASPGDLIPDETKFGVFWMGEKALEAATDRTEAINSLSLTLNRGASEADVIRKVDALIEPYGGTGAYGRKDHLSHAFLDNELMQLEATALVIPPVFLLVATFLVFIVLGRMIRTERTQIGLIKAFGYSDWAIGWHYLKFALVIALLATVGGSLAGVWMGRATTEVYTVYYHFPFLRFHLSPAVFLGTAALSLGSASLGALGGMRGALKLTPAVAMSPPSPPAYGSGPVETFGQWAGFTPIGHMIVRHIVRWPWRSVGTVMGVAMSVGLLFSTMQMIDSGRALLDSYLFRTQRQDLTVTFIEPRNEDVLYELLQLPGVLRVEPTRAVPVLMGNGNREERGAIESTPEGSVLSVRIDEDGREIGLPVAGLMLSRQLADKLDVKAGDRVRVEMLGGRRTRAFLPVASIVDEFIGERAYASQETLAKIARDASPAGAALLKIDPAERARLMAELKEMPIVLGVTEREATLRKFEETLDEGIFVMLFIFIAFASAIAVGVVYNSARILFSERVHELATLRVLGYHRREVGVVLLGELALLIVLSVPVGCIVGYWMGHSMMAMFSSDLYRMPFAPARSSYGWSAVVILIAALLTSLTVARRVLRLDMVRVLKARE